MYNYLKKITLKLLIKPLLRPFHVLFNFGFWEYWEVDGKLKFPHKGHERMEYSRRIINRRCKLFGTKQHHIERANFEYDTSIFWFNKWSMGNKPNNYNIDVFVSYCEDCKNSISKSQIRNLKINEILKK